MISMMSSRIGIAQHVYFVLVCSCAGTGIRACTEAGSIDRRIAPMPCGPVGVLAEGTDARTIRRASSS